jgi:hypothetical protein
MNVPSPSMRVVKPPGDARQEGYRGRLEVSPTGSIPRRENPAGKSPMTRSKPLGPRFASGKMHQRVYGHGHASPDHSVKENGDQNQISRPKVHGTRGRRRRRHDRFRLRFRLVSPVPADSDGKSGAPSQRWSTRLQVRILRLFDQTTPNIAKELYRFSFRSKGRDESVNDLVPHARQSF